MKKCLVFTKVVMVTLAVLTTMIVTAMVSYALTIKQAEPDREPKIKMVTIQCVPYYSIDELGKSYFEGCFPDGYEIDPQMYSGDEVTRMLNKYFTNGLRITQDKGFPQPDTRETAWVHKFALLPENLRAMMALHNRGIAYLK